MIVLDLKDARPLYEQIVEKFQQLILRGILQEDDKMPSVRTLAMELSINPNTIQRAYGELERQGYIYTVKGRGNFVAHNGVLVEEKKKELKNKLQDLVMEAKALGISLEELQQYLTELDRKGGPS